MRDGEAFNDVFEALHSVAHVAKLVAIFERPARVSETAINAWLTGCLTIAFVLAAMALCATVVDALPFTFALAT